MKIENISMEFVAFDAQDVISTSGGPVTITLSGISDGILKNAKVVVGSDGVTYYDASAEDGDTSNLYLKLSALYGTTIDMNTNLNPGTIDRSFRNLLGTYLGAGDADYGECSDTDNNCNATFTWIESQSKFVIQ